MIKAFRQALQNRDLRWVLGAQFVSVVGDGCNAVALSFAVFSISSSRGELSLVLAARVVGLSVALLAGGVIADRCDRRTVMLLSDVARFLSQAIVAGALISGHASILLLAAMQITHGLASGLFLPASAGYVPTIVPKDVLQRTNGALVGSLTLGAIAGPLLAGVLTSATSPASALGLDALTFLASALMLLRVPAVRPTQQAKANLSQFWAELVEGARSVQRTPWLKNGMMFFFASQLLFNGPVFVLGPIVAQNALGGAASWGILVSAFSLGGLLGSAIATRFEPRHPLLAILLVTVAPAALLISFGLAQNLSVLVPFEVLAGAAVTFTDITWWTTLQQQVPVDRLSRVMAWDLFGYTLSRPVSMLVMGPAVVLAGMPVVFLGAGVLLVGTVLATASSASVRRLRSSAEQGLGDTAESALGHSGPLQ
jgi:MFS family permease